MTKFLVQDLWPHRNQHDGDRLVQPLPYETLIFSHFTHFTLRPNSDPTPIRLRVHHSNSDITPTVPRHSPSHAAFHRRSPRSTEFYRIISKITEILLVIIRYILTTDRQPSPLWSLSVIVTRYTCYRYSFFPSFLRISTISFPFWL